MAALELQKAFQSALAAREHAHAPYSRFKVGAALLLESGVIVSGCNVENSSYGGTICAERNAFCAAVAQQGKLKPAALVLITEPVATPCGLCLQVISEFCTADFPIYLSSPAGLGRPVALKELLPHPFGADKLK
jgi:homotetrameric cytidine deaminase